MSYILDALKKSEQERGHGNIPDVQTVHSSGLNYRSEKKIVWPYILIAAVILNLIAITYFILSKETPVASQAIVPAEITPGRIVEQHIPDAKLEPITTETKEQTVDTAMNNSSIVAGSIVAGSKAADKPASVAVTAPQPAAATPVIAAEKTQIRVETQAETQTVIVDFYELPESIKSQLPIIDISAHVYSSNPLQRSIVINNNFMEEGEYVLDGLILYEITPDGAIFSFQGTIFSYGVVSGWP
ncbi:MAG: general secretion pathway protein GspB, partial [Gammaproteobacteria bacterium]|nr:general secretion pathway protein GspB [Gammaproteobacteria bacterium]